jgi:hypothetical protein
MNHTVPARRLLLRAASLYPLAWSICHYGTQIDLYQLWRETVKSPPFDQTGLRTAVNINSPFTHLVQ